MKSYGMFPWVGNKTWGVSFLLSLIPQEINTMVEVFGGSAAFTMFIKASQRMMASMKQISTFVINDRNYDIVNFYHCVRDKPFQLMQACRDYPLNSKLEFDLFLKAVNPPTLEDVDEYQRMRRFLYVALKGIDLENEAKAAELLMPPQLSVQAQNILYRKAEMGDCVRAAAFLRSLALSFRSMGTSYAPRMKNLDRYIEDIANRLSFYMCGVVIYNEDFRKVFARYDAPNALLFCDPPYLGTEDMYRYSDEQSGFFWKEHQDLMELSRATEAKVIITYNDAPTVRELYSDPKFHIIGASHHNALSGKPDTKMNEIFICNYEPPKDSMLLCEQMSFLGGNENESE